MPLETERRPSGIWTVLYQPSLPPKTIDTYQKMFDFLGNDVITNTRFSTMYRYNMSCILVTDAYAKPINMILGKEFGFKVDKNTLIFSEKIDPEKTGILQSGQLVLKIVEKSADSPFSIIDPACYLYDIPYKNMPIAVGDHNFIERTMSELYSDATGKTIQTRLDTR